MTSLTQIARVTRTSSDVRNLQATLGTTPRISFWIVGARSEAPVCALPIPIASHMEIDLQKIVLPGVYRLSTSSPGSIDTAMDLI